MSAARELLSGALSARVERRSLDWLETAAREISGGVAHARFGALISLASRHVPRGPLEPSEEALAQAGECRAGWNPERWTILEGARVLLVLSRGDLEAASAIEALEEAFRYADVGEL